MNLGRQLSDVIVPFGGSTLMWAVKRGARLNSGEIPRTEELCQDRALSASPRYCFVWKSC